MSFMTWFATHMWLYFIIEVIILVFVIGGIWLAWEKPFFNNMFNAIKRKIYGNKGVTIRMIDNNRSETEYFIGLKNGVKFYFDNGEYIFIPTANIVRKTKTTIEFFKNEEDKKNNKSTIKNLGEKEQVTEYVMNNNYISRNWKREMIYTYVMGYSLPILPNITEHLKDHIVDGFKIPAFALKEYMNGKIFVDKIYDDKTREQTKNLLIFILVAVIIALCILGYIATKK